MQRARPLIPFSHDHHHGLVVCRRVREGLKRNVGALRIIPFVLNFWEKDLRRHLEEEERMIFPLLPPDDPELHRALAEHGELRSCVRQLSTDAGQTTDVLADFALKLEAHIRFEERVLFPEIERSTAAAQLSAITVDVEGQSEAAVDWPDPFWKE